MKSFCNILSGFILGSSVRVLHSIIAWMGSIDSGFKNILNRRMQPGFSKYCQVIAGYKDDERV